MLILTSSPSTEPLMNNTLLSSQYHLTCVVGELFFLLLHCSLCVFVCASGTLGLAAAIVLQHPQVVLIGSAH